MAIYHLSAQVIKRSAGRSATAAAAYRAHERIEDERTGLIHDYTRRRGDFETFILAPSNSPEWVYDRAKLWNEAENVEKRKDAQVAREINIALPVELNRDQQRDLVERYAKNLFVEEGMIADVAIHRDHADNPHAHMMLTTREITPEGFGQKNRTWNDKELLEKWRQGWATMCNVQLERAGHDVRIDARSLEAQGIDRMPTIHEGPAVRQMEQRGIQTERGAWNRMAKEHAQIVAEEKSIVVDLAAYKLEKENLKIELAPAQSQTVTREGAPNKPVRAAAPEQKPSYPIIYGDLLEHGAAPYKNDPQNAPSYFVKLNTAHGERTVWGVDLERAIAESGVKQGQHLKMLNIGKETVSVKAPVKNESGQVVAEKTISAERNTWQITPALTRKELQDLRDTRENQMDKLESMKKQYANYTATIDAINTEKQRLTDYLSEISSKWGHRREKSELNEKIITTEAKIAELENELPKGKDRAWLDKNGPDIEQALTKVGGMINQIKNAIFSHADADRQLEPPKKKKKKQWEMKH